jgi:hypothetical protein
MSMRPVDLAPDFPSAESRGASFSWLDLEGKIRARRSDEYEFKLTPLQERGLKELPDLCLQPEQWACLNSTDPDRHDGNRALWRAVLLDALKDLWGRGRWQKVVLDHDGYNLYDPTYMVSEGTGGRKVCSLCKGRRTSQEYKQRYLEFGRRPRITVRDLAIRWIWGEMELELAPGGPPRQSFAWVCRQIDLRPDEMRCRICMVEFVLRDEDVPRKRKLATVRGFRHWIFRESGGAEIRGSGVGKEE